VILLTKEQSGRRYEHFSQVSSSDYFLQLLKLLEVAWLRVPLLQGLITSASVGSESLVRASRSALAGYINIQSEEEQKKKFGWFIEDLVVILESNLADDRYAIPALEISSFLLDGYSQLVDVCLETRYAISCRTLNDLSVY
jgi:tubulin-specific chaperone D